MVPRNQRKRLSTEFAQQSFSERDPNVMMLFLSSMRSCCMTQFPSDAVAVTGEFFSHSRVVDCTIARRGDTGKDQSGLGKSLQRSRPPPPPHPLLPQPHTKETHTYTQQTCTRKHRHEYNNTHARTNTHTHAHTTGKVCDEAIFLLNTETLAFFSYGMLFDVCYYGLFLGPHSQNMHLLMPPTEENVASLKLTMSSILCSLSLLDILFLSSRWA